jgi:hypothetical protein
MAGSTPTNHIPYVPENTLDPAAGLNLALNIIDVLLQTSVTSMAVNTPPGSPSDGERYIVGPTPTGAWTGQAKNLARYTADGTLWEFFPAGTQVNLVFDLNTEGLYTYSSGSWNLASGLTDAPSDGDYYARLNGAWAILNPGGTGTVESVNGVEPDSTGNVSLKASDIPGSLQCISIACSDETTALTAGTTKVTFRNPYASVFTITHAKASLSTAQASGSIFTVDINEAGTTILSTKITIDNTEKTSETAATPPVVSDASIAADAEITVDIDQVGDGTAKGLKIYLLGYPT